MIGSKKSGIILGSIGLVLLTGTAVSAGAVGYPGALKVRLAGTATDRWACVEPGYSAPVQVVTGQDLATSDICIRELLEALAKKRPPPAQPIGTGLTWFATVGGVEVRVRAASPFLPLTDGVFGLPLAVPWVFYIVPEASDAGALGALVNSTGSAGTSASGAAVASDAAAAASGGTGATALLQDLVSVREWSLTALTDDGQIDQLIVCRRSGQSKMLNVDRASIPNISDPRTLVLLPSGLRQRVNPARNLVMPSQFLVLDCPTTPVHEVDVSGLAKSAGRNPI